MNFHPFFEKWTILTPDIRKQPQASLESLWKGTNGWSIEGTIYINLMVKFVGAFPNLVFLQIFQNIDGFRQ